MKELIKIANQWVADERDYTFETRLCTKARLPYNRVGFIVIIDVRDFQYKETKMPIKLHFTDDFAPKVINGLVDEDANPKGDVIEFKKFLERFTKKTYADIHDKLVEIQKNGDEIERVY